jgi:hypothetical protein
MRALNRRLAWLQVASDRDVPFAGLNVFGHRALLQEKMTGLIEHRDVYRLMNQSGIPVARRARRLTDHTPGPVNNVEYFAHAEFIAMWIKILPFDSGVCAYRGKS